MIKPAAIKEEKRIAGLDLIRTIAILSVVVCHSAEFLLRLGNNQHIGGAVQSMFRATQPLGILGVELFFVLSGFLIGGILIRTFMSSESFSWPGVRNFWIRRWMRTLPLYWLILTTDIFMYKAMALSNFQSFQPLYYFFLQNLWYPHPAYFFGEAWSLSVEEWFYLTLPVALLIASRIWPPVNKRKFLRRVFIGYLVVFAACRFLNAFHPVNGADQDFGIRKVVLFRLDAVMYGVIFAYFNYFKKELLNKIKNHLLAIAAAGTLLIYYLLKTEPAAVTAPANPAIRFFSDAFLYLYIPLIFSLCLPFANSLRSIGNSYLSAAITHISRISYGMYLIHYSLIFIPFFYNIKLSSTAAVAAYYAFYWCLVIGIASLLHFYYELPIMRLRDRFSKNDR